MLANTDNGSIFTEFFLMDVSSSRELQILQGLIFLMVYLGALAGNLLTFTIIVIDPHIHSPMYFFMGNLALIDFGYISVTVPKSIMNSLMGSKLISLRGCTAQTFLYIFFGSAEFFFLVVMSYDRYVAICHPLHYGLTMTPRLCTQVAGVSWASGLVYSAVHTGTMFSHPFTKSNVIHQFFCDVPQIMNIASKAVQFSEFVALAVSSCLMLFCFVILLTSYVYIFSTVLHMHSVEARSKALSTCSPQIATFILFIVSELFGCFGHISNSSSIQTLLTAMFYSMVPPLVNPIIFSLRNREIKSALDRMFKRAFQFHRRDIVP
ncbi:olfactory receptor 14I1-like [Manis pentadactyla]|uniref:olfactory receptor 14I1-like n=1 Tax=Manis pentadactyla TaxID=143292 RepID=UPI00255CC7C7|nr:olfactory receptor 14I1-like [Manis pentadactyla]